METSGKARFFEPRKTSYMLFMGFINPNDEGNLDVSQVFSRKCYNAWLSSRVRKPKRPDESFRRALVAHIAGSDGRKPFPTDVETLLLKFIRKRKTWECFEGYNNSSVGILGYKMKGYHESKSLLRKVPQQRQQQQERQENEEENNRPQEIEAISTETKDAYILVSNEVENFECNQQCTAIMKQNYYSECVNDLKKRRKGHHNSENRSSVSSSESGSLCSSWTGSVRSPQRRLGPERNGLQHSIRNTFSEFYENDYIANNVAKRYLNSYPDLLLPSFASFYLNSQNQNSDEDPRLNREFLLPNVQGFDPSLPIGSIIIDSKTLTILGTQNCDHILGERHLHTNVLGYSGSPLQSALNVFHGFPHIKREGSCWFHKNLIRPDGNMLTVLAHFSFFKETGMFYIRVQDVSKKYPAIAQLNPLWS